MRDEIVIDSTTIEAAIVNEEGWKTFITPEQLKELLRKLPKTTKINVI